MYGRSFAITAVLLLLLVCSQAASASGSNTLSLTGSYGSTLVGLEYEKRLGDFGLGLELSVLYSKPFTSAGEPFPLRVNALMRYYFDLLPNLKPYITLAPGALFVFYPVEPAALNADIAFNMHATAGVEFTPGSLRFALEAGYEFVTVFLYPAPASEGWFFLKGGAGITF
jgi:hypothetical protein